MTTSFPSFSGAQDEYRWFQSAGPFLSDLLAAVPRLVVGRYVAVTSFDSGPLRLADSECQAGWTSQESVAYSPRITDPREVPYAEFGEWYVFDHPAVIGSPEVFVNYDRFQLRDTGDFLEAAEPTWRRRLVQDFQERFWAQTRRLAPLTYLADGDLLICVTRDDTLFQPLQEFFR